MTTSTDAIRAAVGAVLIALSTCIHLYFNGKLTGMSGMLFRNLFMEFDNNTWGMMLGVMLAGSLHFLIGTETSWYTFPPAESSVSGLGWPGFVIGGFLVGLGTKMANGCTSGHGICGMPRWSLRSWLAVPTFLSFAIGTANILYYAKLMDMNYRDPELSQDARKVYNYILFGLILIGIAALFTKAENRQSKATYFVSVLVGGMFGAGLIISQMSEREMIRGFLVWNSEWQYPLLIVFAGAVGFNVCAFYFLLKKEPYLVEKHEIPANKDIDWKLLLGSALFGIGWGTCNFCPGPLLVTFPRFIPQITVGIFTGVVAGQAAAKRLL